MKILSLTIALSTLCFSVAAAAPPATAIPGTPSALKPVKHPPYQAGCITGFIPNPSTYDPTSPDASYTCSVPFSATDGCNKQAKFAPWVQNGTGTVLPSKPPIFTYTCKLLVAVTPDSWSPTCGNQAGFTTPHLFDPVTLSYDCLSEPLACKSLLVLDQDPASMQWPAQNLGNFFRYKCIKPT